LRLLGEESLDHGGEPVFKLTVELAARRRRAAWASGRIESQQPRNGKTTCAAIAID